MPTRTNLIANGDTLATSASFDVDAGSPATVHVNGEGNPKVDLLRFDGTTYFPIGEIFKPGMVIVGQGKYAVRRNPRGANTQVDLEK